MKNSGQIANSEVLYYYEGLNGATYIEKNRIRFVAKEIEMVEKQKPSDFKSLTSLDAGKEARIKNTHVFSLYFDGGQSLTQIEATENFGTSYNYFQSADPSQWVTGASAAKELTIRNVYKGIDLRLYSNEDGTFEFDWIVKPGADYSKIDLRFEGQDDMKVDEKGNLEVDLRFTTVKFRIPESYQITPSGKSELNMSFTKMNDKHVHFTTTSKIDSRYPVIIDPTLSWGTFFDGNDADFDQYLFAIQVDPADGVVYCAGGTNRPIQTGSAPYDANGYLNTITGFGTGATPRVPIIYRISANGSDLIDMTLFGPSTVSDNGSSADDNAIAYALSLSPTRVFIGGKTNVNLPMAGSSFDNTRSAYDGFVAVFSRDLGTLVYSSYMGSSGDEDPGITSIRAINDNSYVVGMTAEGSLAAAYITAGVADNSFSGSSDFYIAKFSALGTISWGTYVGGSDIEVFNDLEVFADGRVAFAGFGAGQLTEVNSAGGRSTSTNNEDGILGVLSSDGTTFNYLDELGGSNDDRFTDVEIVGETLYWTGYVQSGFPNTSGTYDTSHNGGDDIVVGKCSSTGGTSDYKATFYGGSGDDLGSGIRLVTQTDCDGVATTFLLVFGSSDTAGSGLPTQNINSETFFDSTNNGGLDIIFGGFKADLTGPLVFGTYMGGDENDYLGDTGAPRGANHLWVSGANVYVGTTTHSASHSPALTGGGGFDLVKTNNSNPASDDTHLIFSIQFNSLLGSDYGDAPASYGTPGHILDCPNLYLGSLVDDEASHQSSVNTNGDDILTSDDEDGVTVLPNFTSGVNQTFSITVNTLKNTTGFTANLYGWIDLNGDGNFSSSEIATTTVANGYIGSKTLTWNNVTVSGPGGNHYVRFRLTTDGLIDNPGTASIDERSTAGASNGEVEDYRCSGLTCPDAVIVDSCKSQSQINTAFNNWLAAASAGGPCNGTLTNTTPSIPTKCDGGTVSATFTYVNVCGANLECTSTFTVTAPSAPVITCPANMTTQSCLSQSQVNTLYTNWLNSVTASGGCAGAITHNGGSAPNACTGGSKLVTFTYTNDCDPKEITCQATFTVPAAPALSFSTCPGNVDLGCNPQGGVPAAVNPATTGGCGTVNVTSQLGQISNNGCQYSQTRTYTATDNCGQTATCSQTFTWKTDNQNPIFTFCPQGYNLGCNPQSIPAAGDAVATDNCGTPVITSSLGVMSENGCNRSQTRTYTATDGCGNTATCAQVFTWTVDTTDPVFTFCPADADLGCNPVLFPGPGDATASDNCGSPTITSALGAVIENGCYRLQIRTYTATDACGNTATCEQRYTWKVDTTDPTLYDCPDAVAYATCITDLPGIADVKASDNCDGVLDVDYSEVQSIPNSSCNNVVTRTWTATDDCGNSSSCTQTIYVNDNIKPTLHNIPQDITAQCGELPSIPTSVFATDNCDQSLNVQFSQDTISDSCPFIVVRTWTVADDCNNSETASQTITYNDTSDPQFTFCPAGADLGCNPILFPGPGQAIATDNCGTPTITSALGVVVEDGCFRSQVRTYTATDACGNTATCEQLYTWKVDTTDPTLYDCPEAVAYATCLNDLPGVADVKASDNCDGVLDVDYSQVQSNPGSSCNNVVTRTWTATDDCGNSTSCVQTIYVNDNIKPTLHNVPENITTQCGELPSIPTSVYATDNCDQSLSVQFSQDTISDSCPFTVVRTWYVVDDCNNSETASQTITYNDTIDPQFTFCPAGADLGCNPILFPGPGQAVATDNCGTPTITSALGVVVENGCFRSQVRTYTATDACGNIATCEQLYTWKVDTTDPVFTFCPQGANLGCNPAEIPAAGQAIATDNCDTPEITSSLGAIVSDGCFRSQTRTYTATDDCGNTSTCEQLFTWTVDHNDPYFAYCPQGGDLGCNPEEIPFSTYAVALDSCGLPTLTFSDSDVVVDGCFRSQTRTFLAIDACCNSTTCDQTFTWTVDTEDPTLNNVPDDITGQCIDIPSPSVVTGSDNCDSDVFVDYDEEQLSEFCPVTIIRTWTAYDNCGNSHAESQTIVIDDTIDPILIGVPADTTVECSSVPAPAVVTFEDNCAFDLNVELAVSSPVADECGYHFTRTWSVQDYCGNVATATQVVTVRDTTDPVFTSCPQGGDLGCNPEEIPAAGGAIATDNCGEPTIVVLPGDIVADGCYRSFTRTYKAYDSCGNDAYCYQTFTWTVDTQDPAFTQCPTAVNLGCNPTEIPFSETLEATDNCGIPVVTYTTSDLSQDGCFHSQTRYFTATDACGNTSTCAQTFTWTVDHNDPYFAYCPQGGDLGCNPEEIPFSTYAVALDSCGLPTLTFSDSDVVVDGCFRSQTRTFLAVDACGNSTTCDQTFVWTVDTEDPTLNNVPDDIIGQCSEIPLPSVVTGSDNCDSDVFVDYDEEQLSEFCPVTIIHMDCI
ncbi:MAG: hypothetical protein IPP69_05745 [Flavobacteriales bacterium]|nr:hypothetical protein [Flavobacteriales bacterium]